MGIGVNYIGSGGGRKTFDLDGVPEAGSEAAGTLGASFMPVPQLGNFQPMGELPSMPSLADDADKGKVKIDDGDTPDVLSRKLAPNGSIMAQGGQLMLRGDDTCGGGRQIYGTNNGIRGFFPLHQFDPFGGGTLLDCKGEIPDAHFAEMNGQIGARVRIGGRTVLKLVVTKDEETNDGKAPKTHKFVDVKEFYRLADITPNGRIVKVSEEIEQSLLMFEVGGGGGKYGVRPFWHDTGTDKPTLSMLAFGTEEDLDTWNGSKFTANDNPIEDAMGNKTYPVLMVGVSTCTNGIADSHGNGGGDNGGGGE